MADEAGYVLSGFDADWVIANNKIVEGDRIETVRRTGPQSVICQSPGGGIAGRSGTTITAGTCTVYKGSAGTLTSLSRTISVYNLSGTAVAASAYLIAALVGDIWVAVWEDC